MYYVPRYVHTDRKLIAGFVRKHPFALLTGATSNGMPVATQIPLLLKEENGTYFLEGHCVKGSDHYRAFLENHQVLAIFTGAHAYISASWYQEPQQASTWNYLTVHIRGNLEMLPEEQLPAMLEELTTFFEQDPTSTAGFTQIPQPYIAKMVKAIAGFRIHITDMNAIFKLSQNRDDRSHQQIIDALDQLDPQSQEIAQAMRDMKAGTFGSNWS